MLDLSQLANVIDKYADNLDKNCDILVRNATIGIIQNLVVSTPIDVGTAESNWQVSVGGTVVTFIPSWDPGSHGSTASSVRHATIDQAKRALASYKFGTSLSIVNNAPYLQRLNEGSSSQAPAGFVEEAILKGMESFNKIPDIISKLLDEN